MTDFQLPPATTPATTPTATPATTSPAKGNADTNETSPQPSAPVDEVGVSTTGSQTEAATVDPRTQFPDTSSEPDSDPVSEGMRELMPTIREARSSIRDLNLSVNPIMLMDYSRRLLESDRSVIEVQFMLEEVTLADSREAAEEAIQAMEYIMGDRELSDDDLELVRVSGGNLLAVGASAGLNVNELAANIGVGIEWRRVRFYVPRFLQRRWGELVNQYATETNSNQRARQLEQLRTLSEIVSNLNEATGEAIQTNPNVPNPNFNFNLGSSNSSSSSSPTSPSNPTTNTPPPTGGK